MGDIAVIGATGDVGRGIVMELLEHGHRVIAIARDAGRLASFAATLGAPKGLLTLAGSVADDAQAAATRDALAALCGGGVDGVVVSVNAPRKSAPLLSYTSAEIATLLGMDLVTHYAAARALTPIVKPGGSYIGIGGGSADFILEGGVQMSVAQAGLRMLYRGLGHELAEQPIALHELIVASVVNGETTRAVADPAWVTEREIGAQVRRMIESPADWPGTVWRIARRDESGRPVISAEPEVRIQGFRQAKEATVPAPRRPGGGAN